MNIRKYIIVKDSQGQELPVIFSNSIQHRLMVPNGIACRPVSAGFLMFTAAGDMFIPLIPSETLNLGPRPQDKELLTDFLS